MKADDDDLREYLTENEEQDIAIESTQERNAIPMADSRRLNSENSSLINELMPLSRERKLLLATIIITDILSFVASGAPAPFFPQEVC